MLAKAVATAEALGMKALIAKATPLRATASGTSSG
jgi:hypothetical protein